MNGERRLLLVHAHPDDESITTGATIASSRAAGVAVTVVTCTLGEEGEVTDPALEGLRAHRADQLGGYRVWELRAALAALGDPHHEFLGGLGTYRDSGMAGDPANAHPQAFSRVLHDDADLARATAAMSAVLERARPQVVVTYPPDGGYGHPDHVAARTVTLAAVDRVVAAGRPAPVVLETVVPRRRAEAGHAAAVNASTRLAAIGMRPAASVDDWAYVVPDDDVDIRIDAGRYLDAKTSALAAHASQELVVPPFYALTNGVALPLDAIEHYRYADRSLGGRGIGTDLFAAVSA
ncbi:N-acetyl-1-D-myo-inositol-2-amino-2-deoxy-alpha-D-glucopyranoside deacetylase [Jatrophihabitans sp. YIM 134969]